MAVGAVGAHLSPSILPDLDLFSFTLDRNAELEAEIAELKDQVRACQSGRT